MTAPAITYDLTKAPPAEMSGPLIVGASIEIPRSQSGVGNAADISGGGMVSVKYGKIELGNLTPANMRYWRGLIAQLAGGQRSIVVPLLVDFTQPDQLAVPGYAGLATDGTIASDGTLPTDIFYIPLLSAAVALNAATVTIRYKGVATLGPGHWFEVYHATKNFRAYVVTDVLSVTGPDGNGDYFYTVGIRPNWREATAINQNINFVRPKCTMRLAPGTALGLDVKGYWNATPDIALIESFA